MEIKSAAKRFLRSKLLTHNGSRQPNRSGWRFVLIGLFEAVRLFKNHLFDLDESDLGGVLVFLRFWCIAYSDTLVRRVFSIYFTVCPLPVS